MFYRVKLRASASDPADQQQIEHVFESGGLEQRPGVQKKIGFRPRQRPTHPLQIAGGSLAESLQLIGFTA